MILLLVAVAMPALPGARTAWAADPVPEEFFAAPEVREFLRGFYSLSQAELRQVLALADPEHPDRLPLWVQVRALLTAELEYEQWTWALDPNQNGGTRTLVQALKQIGVILNGYERVLKLVPKLVVPPAAAGDLVAGSLQWYLKWTRKLRSWHKDAQVAAGILGLFQGRPSNRNLNEVIWYCRDGEKEESDDQAYVVEMLAEGAGMTPEMAVAFGHRVHVVLNSDIPAQRRALERRIAALARTGGFSVLDPELSMPGGSLLFSAGVQAPDAAWPVRLEVELTRGADVQTRTGAPAARGSRPTVSVSGLSPGEYAWRVRALGNDGSATAGVAPGAYAGSHFVIRPAGESGPAAPALVAATPRNDGERPGILLTWQPVPGALDGNLIPLDVAPVNVDGRLLVPGQGPDGGTAAGPASGAAAAARSNPEYGIVGDGTYEPRRTPVPVLLPDAGP